MVASQVTEENLLLLSSRPTLRRSITQESFAGEDSVKAKQRQKGKEGSPIDIVYVGIAIAQDDAKPGECIVGVTVHDGTYSIDYETCRYQPGLDVAPATDSSNSSSDPESDTEGSLAKFVVDLVNKYRKEHNYKMAGGAITIQAEELCPELPGLLWSKLDIVCFVFEPFNDDTSHDAPGGTECKVDEESDSVARKAIEQFGPNNLPRLMVKHGNKVGVDVDGRARLTKLAEYEKSVHPNTWRATMHFADSLKEKKIKIAFFNSTPQGGGVALMRHALIRFLRLVGVDCEWYVPRPKHEVFRITKNNHNILQGVDQTGRELENKDIEMLDEWCEQNATRYWTKKGGPLAARSAGGAHVIVVDDPQMPKLVDIAKRYDPQRPVIYRSHIQVRADLTDKAGSPAAGVWGWVWNHVQKCDLFVSHPVADFVPKIVTPEKVCYMPATTDWLDGLNKRLKSWDSQYYMHEFQLDVIRRQEKFTFEFPEGGKRQYIVQIARFDPAKGIPDVLAAYALLRREYLKDEAVANTPQLVIAGHGAIDDPDAQPIYDETMKLIKDRYPELESDVIVMRVGPTDQILNALMQNAFMALQLSTREGFEVKVSEALHAGRPVIATQRGGIPLQVHDKRSGFLVEAGDTKAVAKYMHHLWTDKIAYVNFSDFAQSHVSDEVSTVGNALCWLYLADELSRGGKIVNGEGERNWVVDMARKEAGIEWEAGENRLPRASHMESSMNLSQ
ncbi:hypothetical protein BDU57DRAFT_281631 [Ampelomyces quisqualis]|uniref:Uncharacterized protein n=1 Tax=Ampelomyces quisqualis TaxID=50730 RepID=A0A6A5QJT5_AMPQU|nr:hypothetical protein BDU57DRAFT_281631 [Ampelomyces quisqualis]